MIRSESWTGDGCDPIATCTPSHARLQSDRENKGNPTSHTKPGNRTSRLRAYSEMGTSKLGLANAGGSSRRPSAESTK